MAEKNLTKTELIDDVAESCKLTKVDARKALNTILDTIADELSKGNKVQLVGFGSFDTTRHAQRAGRNPQNGKPITIPARTVPRFHAGRDLRNAVNN